ncbi:MAG: tyrosine--tRNA ligase [Chloroflexi bacterium]|nr:tyrosine--tRNA ligase [Chloroflexota bacterium]|tara:strand:+ start:7189 stop:8448 length:1260 start_codon:yes stop_codon:yes gene_type:complete
MLDESTIETILHRGVSEIIEEKEFLRLLNGEKKLRLKMGFDPSSPDIHLGHVVGLKKLRQLQELGHKAVVIVGDWTAQIGDPSGQSVTRPMLTHEQVSENAASYLKQFFKVVDRDKTEVLWQSEWLGKFTLSEVIQLTSKFTLAQIIQRDDFKKRWESGRPIAITELLYPLLQGYDSVIVRSDIEFGGTDQKFNLLVGRELQVMMNQIPQQCLMVPILVGTDGIQKMSKSLGNYIGVDEPPNEQYGKIMSLPDNLITEYFELLTDISRNDLIEIKNNISDLSKNPMDIKKRLGYEIVKQFWGVHDAQIAEKQFEDVFQKRGIPNEIPTIIFKKNQSSQENLIYNFILGSGKEITMESNEPLNSIVTALGLVESRSEAKRLLSQDAFELDGHKISNDFPIQHNSVLKIGKRRFFRFIEIS